MRGILSGQPNLTVLMAEVTGVDLAQRTVIAEGRRLTYDTLVIATGATHSYFDHPEWAEVAPA